jgi:ribulose-phosphate 3-epimerase
MNRIISPSVLAIDFSKLNEQLQSAESAGAQRFHLDVMDGHFVPNITFGPFIVDAIRKITNKHLETHLMIENPHLYIEQFIDAGSDTVIIHQEASKRISEDIELIKSKGVKAGIAINPNTNIENIRPYINEIDYIMIMSVFPGFGGQSFIEDTLNSMRAAVEMAKSKDIIIGVDGGVNLKTIDRIYQTGIDVTVVGSGLFGTDNIKQRYNELMNE